MVTDKAAARVTSVSVCEDALLSVLEENDKYIVNELTYDSVIIAA